MKCILICSFFFSISISKVSEGFSCFPAHTRQLQMCFILELWRSLNPIIQSKMEWIGELSTNIKVKKVFQRKTCDDFIFFSKLFRKDLNVTIPPTCRAKAQNLSIWLWHLQQSSLSWLASYRWARKFYISAASSLPSNFTCYCKHGDQKSPINYTLRCSLTIMYHIYIIVSNRENTWYTQIHLK